jgi:tellurite resistance protein
MADAGTYNDPQIAADTNKLYKKTNSEISNLEETWEEKQMELDKLIDGLRDNNEQ